MNQKILFFILCNWSFLNFSSYDERRIQEAQHFRQETTLFKEISSHINRYNILVGQANRSTLKLTCHPKDHQIIDPDKLQLVQNSLGFLYAIYEHQQQQLGHFPTHNLNLDEVSLSIYEHPTLKIIFEIPCQVIIIKPPL